MKLCICGIGGTGKRVASNFLENVDLDLPILSAITGAEYVSPGRVSGVWIDLAGKDAKDRSVFRDLDGRSNERKFPRSVIAAKAIPNKSALHKKIQDKCGDRFDIWTQGTVRDAQFLKVIYELFENDREIQDLARFLKNENNGFELEQNSNSSQRNDGDSVVHNPIFDAAWNSIKPYTLASGEDCQGILFIVSLGGGTGTGFINPIVKHIRTGGNISIPVFVLGILAEHDYDQKFPGRLPLSAISGLYDMLTMENGADGIILMDELILERLCPNDQHYVKQNKLIYKAIRPMILERNYPETGADSDTQATQKFFSADVNGMRPIIIPFYYSQPRLDRKNPQEDDYEDHLIRMAIEKGRLFDCNPRKADKAMVFCRGYLNTNKLKNAITKYTGIKDLEDKELIWINRKMGEKDDEILILLRNPYGEKCPIDPDGVAHPVDGTLENRLIKIIGSAIDYLNKNRYEAVIKGCANGILEKFFFGEDGTGETDGFIFRLKEGRERLYNGERNFFVDPVWILNGHGNNPNLDTTSQKCSSEEEKIDRIAQLVEEKLIKKGIINADGGRNSS